MIKLPELIELVNKFAAAKTVKKDSPEDNTLNELVGWAFREKEVDVYCGNQNS